jgi:hypothetical protein
MSPQQAVLGKTAALQPPALAQLRPVTTGKPRLFTKAKRMCRDGYRTFSHASIGRSEYLPFQGAGLADTMS